MYLLLESPRAHSKTIKAHPPPRADGGGGLRDGNTLRKLTSGVIGAENIRELLSGMTVWRCATEQLSQQNGGPFEA